MKKIIATLNFFLNKKILVKTFTNLHCEIIKEEFLTKKSFINLILFKKILRRFLKWLIINISFKNKKIVSQYDELQSCSSD